MQYLLLTRPAVSEGKRHLRIYKYRYNLIADSSELKELSVHGSSPHTKMKFNLVLFFGLVTLVALCSARPAEEEYAEYEEEAEPAPPPKKPAPARPVVGRRNPLAGRPNNKAASSTTAAPPKEEEVEEEVADYEEEQPQEASSSTTEAPKKFLKGGIVRPFRSNDDLLATLKRRREQVVSNKHSKPVVQQAEADESAPAPVEKAPSKANGSAGRRNRFNGKEKNGDASAAAAGAGDEAATAASGRTGRRFHTRS